MAGGRSPGRAPALVVLGAAVLALLVAEAPTARARRCPAGMASVFGRFCVDVYEASVDVANSRGKTLRRFSPYHTAEPGLRLVAKSRRGAVPQAYFSQEEAQAACAEAGKRLCTDKEWVTACKGRRPTLYPYGDEHKDGYCNDRGVSPLRLLHGRDGSLATFGMEAMNDPRLNKTPGSVARTGHFRHCRNSFGLYDMVGNLHEWTANPNGEFRGGYYLDTTTNGEGCAYMTAAHSTKYHDYSIGFRCCKGGPTHAEAGHHAHKSHRGRASEPHEARTHVVARGQTLGMIAHRYHTTIADICKASGIRRRDPIRPGQKLTLP